MGTAAAPRRVRGEQRSLHQYWVHTILLEHRRTPDNSSVDDARWSVEKFTERGSEGDIGTDEDSPG